MYKNLDRSFFRFVTMHAFGRTDRRTEFSSLDRVCIACNAVTKYSSNFVTALIRRAAVGWFT